MTLLKSGTKILSFASRFATLELAAGINFDSIYLLKSRFRQLIKERYGQIKDRLLKRFSSLKHS